MASKTVAIRLDLETQQRLKNLGKQRDRSPHYLMKEAVEKFLSREEEIEAEKQLMQARWEKYELTGESVSHEDMKGYIQDLISKPPQA